MQYIRRGGFTDVEFTGSRGGHAVDLGRSELPKDRPVHQVNQPKSRVKTLEGIPVGPAVVALPPVSAVQSCDGWSELPEWRLR